MQEVVPGKTTVSMQLISPIHPGTMLRPAVGFGMLQYTHPEAGSYNYA